MIDDVIGMFGDFTPKFVKRYAEIGERVTEAASAYAADVRARRFPGPENCFGAGPHRARRAPSQTIASSGRAALRSDGA